MISMPRRRMLITIITVTSNTKTKMQHMQVLPEMQLVGTYVQLITSSCHTIRSRAFKAYITRKLILTCVTLRTVPYPNRPVHDLVFSSIPMTATSSTNATTTDMSI